ncbi:hydrogen peroxide-inducible genes activator [Prolixibacteraceae bacterium Z1-6]|uniref:Hydrogen peroxide-inducible genes activator n=1 Tax=Draconibacterium aestuarii TaxID=2998507 RepID=A0A9X3J4Y8_9BACT|nr:hydrogen peroxide-inducible genes activator [Prolixibacteraceae bacterium Z1-6]
MNLNQLKYLKELYLQGNFSRAAEKLNLTQPALSLQIQKLEEEIDFKLLDRTKRPLQFTDEGKLFYQKSLEILKSIQELKQISFEISEEVKGSLTVGIIPTLAPYLVPLFIHQLNSQFPELTLEVSELKTEEIISRLKLGNLDCGIISTPVAANGVIFTPLFYERFYIYMSEDHALFNTDSIEADQLDEEEIWYLEEGNCFQNQVNSICKINNRQNNSQNLIYRSSSLESLRKIVENKKGITFLPELATITIPSEFEDLIKDFAGEQPVREISLVTLKSFSKERQVAALQQIISESIPQRMKTKLKSWIVDTNIKA